MTGVPDVDAAITDGRTPPADVEIDETLVRRLLAGQHPDLLERSLRFAADGWDNATWRLGEDLAIRLPRRAEAAALADNEARWLPVLASRVAVAVPEPVATGRPTDDYPYPWSVVRWVDGVPTDVEPLRPEAAGELGAFLADLHGPAPEAAPRNPHRGVPLRRKDEAVRARLTHLRTGDVVDPAHLDRAEAVWAETVDVPIDAAPSWLHSDLHVKNVIGRDGHLAGVIDWGDLGVGDPATDLAAAWLHFPPEAHAEVWAAYGGPSDALVARAKGWAVFFALVCLDSVGDPGDGFTRMGRRVLAAL